MRFQEEGREWRLHGLLYADDLVLCGEFLENLRSIGGRFIEVCKNKVMVLGGEEELECEVCADEIRLEDVSEFKYSECVMEESGTDEAESSWKLGSMSRVAVAIRSLVNAKSLQFECAKDLHESLLVPFLTYGMIWREKKRSRFRAVQMDNFRGLLGIKKMSKVPNARISQFCGVTKSEDKKTGEGVFR